MSDFINFISTRNLICLPGSAVSVKMRSAASAGTSGDVSFQIIRLRSASEDGLHEAVREGAVAFETDGSAVFSFDAPPESGDYRIFFSRSGARDRKSVRLIVTLARVEAAEGVHLLAEDSQILAGLFWRHSTVYVKKFLRSKVFGTRIVVCRASGGNAVYESFNYIAKISSESDVKNEFINLKEFSDDFGSSSPPALPSAGECVIMMGKGGILYDYGLENPFSDCFTLLDWISEQGELEIRTVVRSLLGDLMGETFYRKSSMKSAPLLGEYPGVTIGDRLFGVFNPAPTIVVAGEGDSRFFEAEGEPYYGDAETCVFKGRIVSIAERAMAIDDQSAVGTRQTILVRNMAISKEALSTLAPGSVYTFTLRGAPPITLAEYYSKFVINAYSGFSLALSDSACVTTLVKQLASEESKFKVSTVHGNLHPRNVLVANDGTIMLMDFENVTHGSHVLKDFALLESYIKFWGVIPAIASSGAKKPAEQKEPAPPEKISAQAMLDFEISLDDGGFTNAPSALYPYLIAIDEIRLAAREFLYKSSDMREYFMALFLSELFILSHYYGNYGSRQAHFTALSAGHHALRLRDVQPAAGGAKPPSAAVLACFLFVDVVNFSSGEMPRQLDLFTRMSRIAMELLFPVRRSLGGREQVVTHSTGDGFVFAFVRVPHEDVLKFASDLSRKLAAENIPVRSGLHYGYCYIQKNLKGEQDVVGDGPNATQRIMAVGGAGHILCSEQFTRLFTGSPLEKCFSLLGNAVVKHDLMIKRIYNFTSEGVGNCATPSGITQKSSIEKLKAPASVPAAPGASSPKAPGPPGGVSAGGGQSVLLRAIDPSAKKLAAGPSARPPAPPLPPEQEPGPRKSSPTALTSLKRSAIETGPCLLALTSPYTGKTFFLAEGENVIGRSRKCDVCLRDVQYISGRHALIRVSGRVAALEDCESTNGTFVNDKKVATAEIKEGDIVAFATLKFKFLFKKHKV